MSFFTKFFRSLIRGYQIFISPFLPRSCRFHPTCSSYGMQAFKKHGVIKGSLLTAWRILRCNPYGGQGIDPVPEEFSFKKSFHRKMDLILRKFRKNGKNYIKR